MSNYNFKEFFKEKNPIHNDEFVTNGFILIKKSILTKPQLEFVNSFPMQEQSIKNVLPMIERAKEAESIKIFVPSLINELSHCIIDESQKNGASEVYYNYIKANKCHIVINSYDVRYPFVIHDNDNNFVGILMPMMLKPEVINKSINYAEYLNRLAQEQEEAEKKKENSKKCLYISDNKAIVRNRELLCIADIVNDEVYKNLYVEADYKKDGGLIFADFGFILMHVGFMSHYNTEIDDIKNRVENVKNFTINDYKEYITKCLNNNQFINVAEIKLMELAGESPEYIQKLTDHRQNVLDLKAKQSQEREAKRQQEEQEYVNKKNAEATEQIKKAEQSIINKETLHNKDITIYGESKYDSNTTSIVLYLMKQYNINVPLKTQGWINKALAQIEYDSSINQWTYRYYTSSANSTVFMKYMKELIQKIDNKYQLAG